MRFLFLSMKKLIIILLLLLPLLGVGNSLQAQHVISVGPMFHLNFGGGGKTQMSYGFEVAYWNAFGVPYGVDLGIDFEKGAWRVYSEAQAGVVYAGMAAGPYLEFKKDEPVKLGLQTSVWANIYFGIDMRARFTRGESRFAPGVYAKYVFTPGGNLWDELRENHESEDSDWDWD
ncbi:hypothetical protein D770_25480 [Flammeovirgaceae bacterium 311]|nr:hypothetical protein D770_25480 [Flammeovirgaceae bacterium 311]